MENLVAGQNLLSITLGANNLEQQVIGEADRTPYAKR